MPIYSIKEVSGDFTDSLSNSGDFKVSSKIDISHIPVGLENLSSNNILGAFDELVINSVLCVSLRAVPVGPLRAEIRAAFLLNALAVPQREPSSVSREFSFMLWVSGELPKLSGSVPLLEEVFELTLYKWYFRMGHWVLRLFRVR
ncbi:hypothetical protein TNCV_3482371 [Trichonephila clavipes]|nr:hypothetical protein TNCV_3482371 [Trichonephila clavipes]